MKSLKKLTINVIEGIKVKREDVRAIVCPQSPGTAPMNWTAIEILAISLFHNNEQNFTLLPLPKGKDYLLCMSLSFKKSKTFLIMHFMSFQFIHFIYSFIYIS